MKSALRVQRKNDELRIAIRGLPYSGGESAAQAAAMITGAGAALCSIGIINGPDSMGIFLFCLCTTVVLGYLFFRAIDKLSLRERIIIRKQEMLIGQIRISSQRWRSYRLAGISAFAYLLIKDEEHPSAAPSDLQREHGCGGVFRYHAQFVQFGLGLHSWEVDELEGLIADFTGYDLRYDGSGEYGAVPEHVLHKPLALAGQWAGSFVRTDPNGIAAEEAIRFRLYIDEADASGFRGRWLELNGYYAHLDPAEVEGYLDDERVEFTKQFRYAVSDGLDGYRAVDDGCLSPTEYFEGTYNELKGLLSGNWEQYISERDKIAGGTWEARKDD
ncbi:MAG: hypothetical protein EOO15_22080 [Chitinophagaceae bacterium]|nr:MAG: hypothetical protein EOO15_22080 [Chitinophagaceae bacterium]